MTLFPVYFDEDSLWAARAFALRALGFDVLTALGAETLGFSDEEQLAFAAEQGRELVTVNARDFTLLNAEWFAAGRPHPGLVFALQEYGYSPGEFGRRMLRLSAEVTPQELGSRIHHLSSFGASPTTPS